MRIFQHYNFAIGTKIPFHQCPAIVLRFLNDLGLHHQKLLYYFSDYVQANVQDPPNTACHRASKENPQLGCVYEKEDTYTKTVYITNIGDEHGCKEDELLSLIPKLSRRYAFVDSVLTFDEIDFFHRNSISAHNVKSTLNLQKHPTTSYIKLIRSCRSKDNAICIVIEITNGDSLMDASLYQDAFAKLVPNIPCESYQTFSLTDDEQTEYDVYHDHASSLLASLCHQEPEQWEPDKPAERTNRIWTLSPILKQMLPKHGYTYHKREFGFYYFYRKDSFGHVLMLELDAEPRSSAFLVRLLYNGPGFSHSIPIAVTYQAGKTEFRSFMQYVFSKVQQLEETILIQVGSVYPPTPSWFVAND